MNKREREAKGRGVIDDRGTRDVRRKKKGGRRKKAEGCE